MQRYIIDTHTLLWYWSGDSRLSLKAKDLLEQKENQILLSVASLWEMAVKISINKLTLPVSFADVKYKLAEDSIELLQIQAEDAEILAALPFHHRDPFDRMIIAQAQHHQIPVIGIDEIFKNYLLTIIWE